MNQNEDDLVVSIHRGVSAGRDMDPLLSKLEDSSEDNLIELLHFYFPNLVAASKEQDYPFSERKFSEFSFEEILSVLMNIKRVFGPDIFNRLSSWRTHDYPHFRREFLRYGCAADASVRLRTRMSAANPPAEIHSMIRASPFVGDLYSTDMIIAAVRRAGFAFLDEMQYLDFGCSSGAVVRTLSSAFPAATWLACDPVEASIKWASEHFPTISFFRNNQDPPLPIGNKTLGGAYAVSIWSHFSERAALSWFDEMHRVIVPDGFLCFTTHGFRSVCHYLEQRLLERNVMAQMVGGMVCRGHAFQPVWESFSPEADNLDTADWGNAYFVREWIENRLREKWVVADYRSGLNQLNQDIYVLKRM